MNINRDVDEGMQAVRETVLGVDPRIPEARKWSSPTFICRGTLAFFIHT